MSFWSFFMRDTYPSRLVRLAPLVEVVKRISFASRCLHGLPTASASSALLAATLPPELRNPPSIGHRVSLLKGPAFVS